MGILLYMMLCPALFYLGSRARVTEFLWKRYPQKFARFMDCPACTGFWYGWVLASFLGVFGHIDIFGLDPFDPPWNQLAVGLAMVFWTPIGAGLMQWGFDRAGSVLLVCACPADDHAHRGRHHDPGCALYSLVDDPDQA